MSFIRDINADGYVDIIVGAYLDDNNGEDSGSVTVFSGANGSILYVFNGTYEGARFGYSVDSAGDINNDGYEDIIVGASGDIQGSAKVFSGKDGQILRTFYGGMFDQFGEAVSGAGDVNNDGYADVIIGAPGDADYAGSATVYSGQDGVELYAFYGGSDEWSGDGFGDDVSGAGDVNNDGYDDVIVGAIFDDNNGSESGSAQVFSGIDGAVLYVFNGSGVENYFGISVSAAGDVNNDGYADVIVGDHWNNINGMHSGSAWVFSGMNGSVLYRFNGDGEGDQFGFSVKGAGDVNNDGYADVVVGANTSTANGEESGKARVLSGKNGSILYVFEGDSEYDYFGSSVDISGDVNNDGYMDIIVGTAQGDEENGPEAGYARVFSGKSLWMDTDGDGQNDAADNDDDNDGILDINDPIPGGVDTDSDGILNSIDWDDDNDGVLDTIDVAPLNAGDTTEIILPLDGNYKGGKLGGGQLANP